MAIIGQQKAMSHEVLKSSQIFMRPHALLWLHLYTCA